MSARRFDPDQDELFREDGGRLEVDGSLPVRRLAEHLQVELDEHHETTIGGYLSEQHGRVPQAGEQVEALGHWFDILEAGETLVERVAVRRTSAKDADEEREPRAESRLDSGAA